ncbi:MAG: hypothetical protein AAFX79_00415 [Planctomycetota bacterium]
MPQRTGRAPIGRVAAAALACLAVTLGATTSEPDQPVRRVQAAGAEALVLRDGVRHGGVAIEAPLRPVDAAEFGGLLLVAGRDGVVDVFRPTDAGARRVHRVENLGRGLVRLAVADDVERVLALAADSLEIFGFIAPDPELTDEPEELDPIIVDHARFCDFLRGDDGVAARPRTFALGQDYLVLATDDELLQLIYQDRSYRVHARHPLPDAIARVEDLAFTGSRWVLAGLDRTARPVLWTAPAVTEAWTDLGVDALDAALSAGGEPIAWLPGGLSVGDGSISLAIRGERPGIVGWPADAASVEPAELRVRWLDATESDDGG